MTDSDSGQVTGTTDKDYNIIWFTEVCLSLDPPLPFLTGLDGA